MSSEPDAKLKEHPSGTVRRKHRSRSTPRYNDVEKPRKKRHISAATSLVTLPNTIKLSMLNSGLLPTSRYNSKFYLYTAKCALEDRYHGLSLHKNGSKRWKLVRYGVAERYVLRACSWVMALSVCSFSTELYLNCIYT